MSEILEILEPLHLATLELSPLVLEGYESPTVNQTSTWHQHVGTVWSALPRIWQAYWAVALEEQIPQTLGLREVEQCWEVDLVFVSNPEIQALNRDYRGKDQPTDVLSFTLLADSPQRSQWVKLPTVQLGSLFISAEWACHAVAEMAGASTDRNFRNAAVLDQYMLERVIHGWLHLMGVNHDSMEEYNRVVGIQKRVLEKGFHEAN